MTQRQPGTDAGDRRTGLPKLLSDLAGQAGPILLTAGGFIGFVAFVGGAVTWARFYAAKIPADEAVAVVPKSDLVVTGAGALGLFAVLGALAVLFCYLIQQRAGLTEGEPPDSARMLRAVLFIATVESLAVVVLESGGKKLQDVSGAFLLVLVVALLSAALIEGAKGLGRRRGEATGRPPSWLVAFLVLVAEALAIGAGISAWAILDAWWLAIVIPLSGVLAYATYLTWTVTRRRFEWFGVAVFFSAFVFGGAAGVLRSLAYPQIRPAALIRTGDARGEGVEALFVANTDKRVWLASTAASGCEGERLRGGSGRLFSVPQDQVETLVVGAPQRVRDAARRAPEMLADLLNIRVRKPAGAGSATTNAPTAAPRSRVKTPLPQPVSSLPVRREPRVDPLQRAVVARGETVLITGSEFGHRQGRVRVGRTFVPVVTWADKKITVSVRPGVATGHLRVECPRPVNGQLLRVFRR